MRSIVSILAGIALITVFISIPAQFRAETAEPEPTSRSESDRSPVDLVLSTNEKWLLTVNHTAHSVSVVDLETTRIVQEIEVGEKPSAIALTPDEKHVLVTGDYSRDLSIFRFEEGGLSPKGRLTLGHEPRGIAISPDGRTAYVALRSADSVSVINLDELKESARIKVGRWPRYLALNPDGTRLAVGVSGSGGVAVVDTKSREVLYLEDFAGLNLGQMFVPPDGKYVYFPYIAYGQNPITRSNIQRGWVLASRMARVRLDKPARREAIALDPRGQAVADPHAVAISPDNQWAVLTAPGTHELLIFKHAGLPFQDYGGPGDHIDEELLNDSERFARIDLGGRPMGVRFSNDGRRLFVANYLLNAIQVVDVARRKIVQAIELGGPLEPALARRGEAIFYDGQRSLDQWYSCHSCHYDGHGNSTVMDTRNDGRFGNFKTVPSLRNVTRTGPWTWHGWQEDFHAAIKKSMTETMLGRAPSDDDIAAVQAYLETLTHPAAQLSSIDKLAIERGAAAFKKARCSQCHTGELFTDGKIHEVGLESSNDRYDGFNTPSLIGVGDRILYFHDGRSDSLEDALHGPHSPADLTGVDLTDVEINDLIAYLRSL